MLRQILFYRGKSKVGQKFDKLRFTPPNTSIQGKFFRRGKTYRDLFPAELPGMKIKKGR